MAPSDPYGVLGEKYRFLLGVPRGVSAYLSGPYWETLAGDFSAAGIEPIATPEAARLRFLTLEPGSRPLPALASPTGTARHLVLLVKERQGLGWRSPAPRAALTPSSTESAREFLAQPSLAAIEAFVSPGAAGDSWTLRRGFLARAAARMRFPVRHRMVFLLPRDAPDGFARAEQVLASATGETGAVVERYHLRRRGAIVFVLAAPSSNRFVVRVATNPRIAELTGRNHTALRGLLARPALPDLVRQALPAPLGESAGDDATAFVEEYREGRLAWTLYRDESIRRRVDEHLFRFTHALQTATAEETGADSAAAMEPVRDALDRIQDRLGSGEGIADRLGEIGRRTRNYLARKRRVAFAHGDFGVGNALVTPAGALSGVIDWDQSRPRDLPGLDWCNHVIKGQHFRRSTLEGLRALVRDATATGMLAPEFGGFGKPDFALDEMDMRSIPCLAVLWDLARSAPFGTELTGNAAEYRALLDGILELLPPEPA